ncbi:hypothetical protein SELMODRAFT_430240 [Selaginella moellendorffii]|uniref:Uncharacterized protein n=1 Tax=Selaginella moellendorffii TaxID=88036 RepID=D8T8S8_SELML|nr:hypothetical protein SELMODRAFT_430240 [Selaginella moellendorffii]
MLHWWACHHRDLLLRLGIIAKNWTDPGYIGWNQKLLQNSKWRKDGDGEDAATIGDLDNDTLLCTFDHIPARKLLTRAALVCRACANLISLKNAQETVLSFIPHLRHLSIFTERCVECIAFSIKLPEDLILRRREKQLPEPPALLTFPNALQLESLGQNAPVLLKRVPGSNQTNGKH